MTSSFLKKFRFGISGSYQTKTKIPNFGIFGSVVDYSACMCFSKCFFTYKFFILSHQCFAFPIRKRFEQIFAKVSSNNEVFSFLVVAFLPSFIVVSLDLLLAFSNITSTKSSTSRGKARHIAS